MNDEVAKRRRQVLLHRLRTYRDRIDPGRVHTCSSMCIREECLIVSALRYIEENDCVPRQVEV